MTIVDIRTSMHHPYVSPCDAPGKQLPSSHLTSFCTFLYSIFRIKTLESSLKMIRNVPGICFAVDKWMKLSLLSSSLGGSISGSGDGVGEDDGIIL